MRLLEFHAAKMVAGRYYAVLTVNPSAIRAGYHLCNQAGQRVIGRALQPTFATHSSCVAYGRAVCARYNRMFGYLYEAQIKLVTLGISYWSVAHV